MIDLGTKNPERAKTWITAINDLLYNRAWEEFERDAEARRVVGVGHHRRALPRLLNRGECDSTSSAPLRSRDSQLLAQVASDSSAVQSESVANLLLILTSVPASEDLSEDFEGDFVRGSHAGGLHRHGYGYQQPSARFE